MLSRLAQRDWLWCLGIAALLAVTFLVVGWYVPLVIVAAATLAVLGFFRDPNRRTPTERGLLVSPADGRVSSIHRIEHFGPFNEPATCVRVFLSVFDVHVNRSPCHGRVVSVMHTPGAHRNALNPDSAEVNENNLVVLHHPTRDVPVAAVRQIAGLIARRVVCSAGVGQILQRGQRMGIIKFASTTELYVPDSSNAVLAVEIGQRVTGGITPLFRSAVPANEPHPSVHQAVARPAAANRAESVDSSAAAPGEPTHPADSGPARPPTSLSAAPAQRR
jgi:phosphatidylserine decarboxylase